MTSSTGFSALWKQNANTGFTGKTADLVKILLGLFTDILNLEKDHLCQDMDLRTFHIESILLLEIAERLETDYGISARADELYTCRTVEKMAALLMGNGTIHEPSPDQTRHDHDSLADIAVIGMSGQFPQSRTLAEFWRHLEAKEDVITPMPKDRWGTEPQAIAGKWGGFIADVDKFDAPFFRISPKEAELMDPQQRIIMQTVWETIEDAGYPPSALSGTRTGLFLGIWTSDYEHLMGKSHTPVEPYTATGTSFSVLTNRISYFLDIHGPSEPVDTACSASLVAIHRAVWSLRNRECSMALAGGVNLILSPRWYTAFEKAGMLSPDGRCRTFDEKARGYGRSEGVGVILLKPLKTAIADKDHIYGVIKSSAINHGGYANSLTAPNPDAQATLLREAYENADIDPATVSYIETHGTGTPLGDPIEINGIKKAFSRLYREKGINSSGKNRCGLGSVKTSMGHAESAAGIAGVIKVLLAMQHKKLPGTVHFNRINPAVTLADSPFYIVDKTQDWKPVEDEQGKPVTRAGVSSFGFGGVNAHVVLEANTGHGEPPPGDRENGLKGPVLFVLSARNQERLRAYAGKMQEFLVSKGHVLTADALPDIAYTLQVGREAMEERLAMAANAPEGVVDKLKRFAAGEDHINGLYHGNVKQYKKTPNVPGTDRELNGATDDCIDNWINNCIDQWIECREYAPLLSHWVKGGALDWNRLYPGGKPSRISLPTYPFAKKRYWIPRGGNTRCTLHPLLHENTSDLTRQRFSSHFTGDEFFFADHVVAGRRMLPASAHLELALAAVERATAGISGTGIRFKHIVWVQPILMADEPIKIHIRLLPENSNGSAGHHRIAYEIYNGDTIFSRGKALIGEETGDADHKAVLDIAALRSRCVQRLVSGGQCYEMFGKSGLSYGPGFRCIQEAYTGDDRVLAKLALPAALGGAAGFTLHPAMLDAALQAAMVLVWDKACPILRLPFELAHLEVFNGTKETMWAYARYHEGDAATVHPKTLDIDLADEQGNICARMRQFSLRSPGDAGKTISPPDYPQSRMLVPVWAPVYNIETAPFPPHTQKVLLLGGDEARRKSVSHLYPDTTILCVQSGDTISHITGKLDKYPGFDHVVWMAPFDPSGTVPVRALVQEQESGVICLFNTIKALLARGYDKKSLGWTIITMGCQQVDTKNLVNPAHAGIHGLAGAMSGEYPNWRVRLVDLSPAPDSPMDRIFRLPANTPEGGVCYRSEEWHTRTLLPLHLPDPMPDNPMYRRDMVCVVIGGAGGIGAVFSEHMIRKYNAKIVWIGRRNEDEKIRAKKQRLGKLGVAPLYVCADASDPVSLASARDAIKTTYPQIHGVVHSTIVLADAGLMNMTLAQFRAAHSAKADVCVHMARVFEKESLDFMLFFSSVHSFSNAPGQGNYAAGSTFTDAFAKMLSQRVSFTVKIMNWGYWGDVGIVASHAYRKRMEKAGMGSIDPKEGMAALDWLMSCDLNQLVFAKILKPDAIRGSDNTAVMAVYPEPPSLCPGPIPESNAVKKKENPVIKKETTNQIKEMDTLLRRLFMLQIKDVKEKNCLNAYHRWFEESRRIAAEKPDHTGVSHAPDMETAWKEWDQKKEKWLKNPDLKARVNLVDATMRALPTILQGRVPATDILFPGASMDLVQGIYANNTTADFFNNALCDILVSYILWLVKNDPGANINILEIGAGTGGTSGAVFQRLAPYAGHITEYTYSDVSKAFLLHGEKKYGKAYPYTAFKRLDIEQPLGPQDIGAGTYDIVLAANVLHATRNIRNTLGNAKAALKKNGLLILNEITGGSLFYHLTFGLLEGWWAYEDTALRIKGCPGLSPRTWAYVLENHGFSPVVFPVQKAHSLGQQIIAAKSNGIVIQRYAAQPCGVTDRVCGESTGQVRTADISEKATTANALESHVKQTVLNALETVLHMDPGWINDDNQFADLGVDSILGIQLVHQISQTLDIELEATLVFDHSSVNRLTAHILSAYPDRITGTGTNHEKQSHASGKPALTKEEKSPYLGRFIQKPVFESGHTLEKSAEDRSIAIIGMACRFAKSDTPEQLWTHLVNGSDLIEKVSRWELSQFYPGKTGQFCNHGSFLDNIDRFDPLFFNISGREATYMDPQQRIFLEEAWHALEDAGYAGKRSENTRCGVYVGCNAGDYEKLFEHPSPAESFWGNSASITPARIAYYLNLKGPAISVDTACSSSLVAIHMACQGLWENETTMALAGGVFVQSTPGFYLSGNKAQMLSLSGRCHTFDDRADGFVLGEGVGVVILKRLNEAVSDNDHIYGVIKGIGMNQDGATNGITAPSAASQENLEQHVYDRFGINPERIQMMEAHGTGTPLGDPIEFRALQKAFQRHTRQKNYCALGSIKTNIGHTVNAAGVAGVIKILLSLRHKTIPPSLNFTKGNAVIDFEQSPFFINTRAKLWDTPPNQKRCAAVSSFGFSGTNAHMVIEQAPETPSGGTVTSWYLITLSAATPDRLKTRSEQLLSFCKANPDINLGNMSFTLLQGRKHLDDRLACVVRTLEELEDALEQWLRKGHPPRFYTNEAGPCTDCRPDETNPETNAQNDADAWLTRLSGLAQRYVQGCDIESERLFTGNPYKIIPLPTYPFARERYWVPAAKKQAPGPDQHGNELHPFIDRLVPTLPDDDLIFEKTLSRKDLFAHACRINGVSVFPEAGLPEMMHAALSQVKIPGDIVLEQVVWATPVSMQAGKKDLRILIKKADSHLRCEVQSGNPDDPVIHGIADCVDRPGIEKKIQRLSIKALGKKYPEKIDLDAFYTAFSQQGISYTPDLKAVKTLWFHENGKEGVCRLDSGPEAGKFTLHPAMLAAAFNAMAFLRNRATRAPLGMDSIGRISLFSPLESEGYAYIRMLDNLHFDVALLDNTGLVCMTLHDVALKPMEDPFDPFFYKPEWVPAALDMPSGNPMETRRIVIIYPETSENLGAALANAHTDDQVFHLRLGNTHHKTADHNETINTGDGVALSDSIKKISPVDGIYFLGGVHPEDIRKNSADEIRQILEQGVISLFWLIKSIIDVETARDVQLTVVTSNGHLVSNDTKISPYSACLSGLARVAAKEHPGKFNIVCVDVDDYFTPGSSLADQIVSESRGRHGDSQEDLVAIRDGQRYVRRITAAPLPPALAPEFRQNGVYLITGGAGGIGLAIGEHLCANFAARLVLIGRTGSMDLNPGQKAAIEKMRAKGGTVEYLSCDITDFTQTERLIRDIVSRFGRIHGVLHGAAVLRDTPLESMDEQGFREVLRPKINGGIVLHQALKTVPLDFFLFFSSVSGSVYGIPGQANFGAANTFSDGFALYLSQTCDYPVKVINWGGWGDGDGNGLGAAATAWQQLLGRGLLPITPEEGMETISRVLHSDLNQVAAVKANNDFIQEIGICPASTAPEKRIGTSAHHISGSAVKTGEEGERRPDQAAAADYLKALFAEYLRIPETRIENDVTFDRYGLNSLMAKAITGQLETVFGKLPVTLLVEHKSIHAVAGYLMAKHPRQLIAVLGQDVRMTEVSALFPAGPAGMPDKKTGGQKMETQTELNDENNTFMASLSDDEIDQLLLRFTAEDAHE